MAASDFKIISKDGVHHISGVIDEYSDFDQLTQEQAPLKLNFKEVSRINSIGIRNLLKFLNSWGDKELEYSQCPSEIIDQINMIPGLLGSNNHVKINSLFVPYECVDCEHEADIEHNIEDFKDVSSGNPPKDGKCPKCGGKFEVLTPSFFDFHTSKS